MLYPLWAIICGFTGNNVLVIKLLSFSSTLTCLCPTMGYWAETLKTAVVLCQLDPCKRSIGELGRRQEGWRTERGHASYCLLSLPLSVVPRRHFIESMTSFSNPSRSPSCTSQKFQCQLGTTPSSETELQHPCSPLLSYWGLEPGRQYLLCGLRPSRPGLFWAPRF